jgi:hypothetical protein
MPFLNADLRDTKADNPDRPVWTCLPDGEYVFIITGSELKPAKSGQGSVLHLKLECGEADYKGTRLMDFLTLEHSNSQTVQIAKARLKAIAVAVGHKTPDFIKMSEELHNKPLLAVVRAEAARDPKYGDVNGLQNRIVGYKKLNGRKADQVDAEEMAEIEAAVEAVTGSSTEDDLPF